MTHKVINLDLDNLTHDACQDVLEILKKELVVVIKKQPTESYKFARLIHGMNHTIANFQQCVWNEKGDYDIWDQYKDPWECDQFPVQRVTAQKNSDDDYTGIFPRGKLDWHANLNGPNRADGVALQGIRGVEGTVTSWLNTAVAYEKMPDDLKKRLSGVHCSYRYNMHNWADIDNPDQLEFVRKTDAPVYHMYIEQQNNAGTKGLYFYDNNELEVKGKDTELYDDLKEYLFQEEFIYHHEWEVGDIVLSDQLLTLHRRPVRPDEVFEKRLLHRYTFPISNTGMVKKFIEERNVISRKNI